MKPSSNTIYGDIARQLVHERAQRATGTTPQIPATAYRHLLAQRLLRVADRVDA